MKGKKKTTKETDPMDTVISKAKKTKRFGTFSRRHGRVTTRSNEDTGSFSIKGRSGPMLLGIND